MDMNIPAPVREITEKLEKNGFEAFCVGGCVRDCIMGLTPSDWDIAASALPDDTERIFADYHLITAGKKHGTVAVIINKTPYEITTYRVDGEYGDNRHPLSVSFTKNIENDLSRRDFTVNAIAYNERTGTVDPFGGTEDIYNSIIRTVGNADERFREDGLRIMRALRFSATLGFTIEENTAAAIHRHKDLLKNISAERISAELVKLLCGKNAFAVLMEYPDVLSVFIPEIAAAVGFKQYGEKHAYDVWEHICHTVDTIPADRTLRLTMLLHDLGKMPTHALNEKGVSTFKNHASVGGEIAKEILTRLKFDKKTVNHVSFLVANHDFEPPETKILLKKHLSTKTPDDIRTLLTIKKSDRGALSEKYRDISEGTRRCLEWLGEIEANGECCTVKDLAVNGSDLLAAGVKSNEIGNVLNTLLDAVITEKVKNRKDDLLTYIL